MAVSADAVTSQVIPELQQAWSTPAGDIRRQTQQNAVPVRALNSSTLSPQALFRELATNGMTASIPDPQLSNQVDVGYALQNLAAYLQYTPPSPRLLAGGAGYEHSWRLIVDPGSGRLLDAEDVQIDPSAVKIPTPFVFSYTLFLRSQTTPGLQRP